MVLNRIWTAMFLIAFVMGFSKLIFWQDLHILQYMMDELSNSLKSSFEIALFMTGTLAFWMGIMKIGENGGAITILAKGVSPLFSKLFPEIPKNHPAIGSIMMNFSANMLGLDNAATPLGLKAMADLQELNPDKTKASNAQIMFLVLNASGLTIIPVSILAARAAAGSNQVSSVFLPILITTYFATIGGLIFVSIRQRINLFNKTVILYIGSLTAIIISLLVYLNAHPEQIETISSIVGNSIIFGVLIFFFLLAIRAKINLYDSFIEGAKDGFQVAVNIIPYLVGMLAAVALFRASGALNDLLNGFKFLLSKLGILTDFVDALPVLLMKPFSGSGARGLMVDMFENSGVDSFTGKLASTFQGSTETTFYVLSVYFGSVKISNTRYAALAGLFCDLVGGIAAILVAYLFYR